MSRETLSVSLSHHSHSSSSRSKVSLAHNQPTTKPLAPANMDPKAYSPANQHHHSHSEAPRSPSHHRYLLDRFLAQARNLSHPETAAKLVDTLPSVPPSAPPSTRHPRSVLCQAHNSCKTRCHPSPQPHLTMQPSRQLTEDQALSEV